ncbi:MAG: BamA/TamA family outer membrane protein [Bacteroidota bacterium]|nr:BamA/TamA family outer membrane protein [Bacteroidota bacterium]
MLEPLKPVLILIAISLLLCPSLGNAQRPPELEKIRKREISEIRFEGNNNISSLELESIIATRTSSGGERILNWLNSDWGTPQQFVDEGVLAEDTTRIFVYYRSRGYFDAHIGYSLHESVVSAEQWQKVYDKNKFLPPAKWDKYPVVEDTIAFRIYEGKPYVVSGFTFEGLEHLPMDLQNKLTDNIGIKAKSVYSKDELDKEVLRIQQILGENGYPFLSLPTGATIIELDRNRKSITISIKFKTGPRVRVGAPRIVSDTAYSKYGYVSDATIHRALSLDSGAWYKNSNKLISERDLSRLGTFQYINIELDTSGFYRIPDSSKDGIVLPVIVYLRMRPSWDFTPYPYLGINPFYQFILGFGVSYSNRNLFNVADNFTTQAVYQLFPRNQNHVSLSGDFVFPYIGIKNVPLVLSANSSYSDQRTPDLKTLQYLERTITASLGTNVQLSHDPAIVIYASPKGLLQYVNRDYRDSSIFNGRIDTTTVPSQFNALGSLDMGYNSTNDPQNPSRGIFVGMSLQRTLQFIANAIPTGLPSAAYTKFTPQFKAFANLGVNEGRSILAYRILYGNVWLDHPGDQSRDILIENRYFGGGTNSMRGWAARTLLVSNNPIPGHPQYGGYKTIETNLEWRYALFHYPAEITATQQFLSALRIAFFCDVGNVWDKDVPIAIKNLAVAIGTGIRYNTLLGALRFDFGFKFYDPYPDPYPPGTLGKDKPNKDILLAIPPNASAGVFMWDRKGKFWNVFADVFNFEFALGQPF